MKSKIFLLMLVFALTSGVAHADKVKWQLDGKRDLPPITEVKLDAFVEQTNSPRAGTRELSTGPSRLAELVVKLGGTCNLKPGDRFASGAIVITRDDGTELIMVMEKAMVSSLRTATDVASVYLPMDNVRGRGIDLFALRHNQPQIPTDKVAGVGLVFEKITFRSGNTSTEWDLVGRKGKIVPVK